MPPNPPQTLSVKRKRNEAPVDALVIENDGKRFKSGNFSWKLVPNPKASVPPALLSPSTAERRFFLDPAAARRVKHVFVEARPTAESKSTTADRDLQAATTPEPTPAGTPRPRKRPGAGSALNKAKEPPADHKQPVPEPSADDVRRFEEFSKSVEKEESGHKHITSPLKYKPKAPAQRFKDRHPEKAAEMDHDAMDVDSDEYVYDTYIRQDIVPDANGKIPEPQGTVGFIVIGEDDEEWWNGDDESDKEFATDDEDENAEDYYANDYPEDELSSDDEYDRNLYQRKYRHGSDDEEYDLNDDDGDDEHMRSDEDDDDKHFRMTAAQTKKPKPAGYWGKYGE